ncbi:hypothetical protein JCM17844_04620 [Iodidimonas gelatinilytica]|uniref:DUF2971 domain-containing protein n=1 Tax=Iodidimonas gelatinilytica TaxID=1236966 RepID=A0A5A7MP77_9PROT|nr:DUF2971 domain-containing protein [Iodidimonas gelatinilytica]GEQ96825.1 hypothetical protein JCM17844_04620 [Iodidimonas gelatinilytica]
MVKNHLYEQIEKIFLPYYSEEMKRIEENNIRFSHYTSAEAGLKIIQSNKMLLRNSKVMNDFSEGHYGWECLSRAYNGPSGERLKTTLRKIQNDLPQQLEDSLNSQYKDILDETYLMSVSEHDEGHEDEFGRLSMWRAYAPKDGVALIMNNGPFLNENNALNAFSFPVLYTTPDKFLDFFQEIATEIEKNINFLENNFNCKGVFHILNLVFRSIVQSTKHPAFQEEKEWRVIHSPTLLQTDEKEEQLRRVPTEILEIGGVPQRVYAIPFRDYPEETLVGVTLPHLLDRLLIGPSQHSHVIAQAFIAELTRLKVPNPEEKVIITGIPLRT